MKPAIAAPDINAYVLEHGRLPRLGEKIPPFAYRGWLLWMVQLADDHPGLSHRWGYYIATREAGHLLSEPIPQTHFGDHGSPAGVQARKDLERWVERIYQETGSWSALSRLVEWLAFGLAVSSERPAFSPELDEWLYRNVDIGPMLLAPSDYLGAYLSDTKVNKYNSTGFYPTPHEVVEMMTVMTMHDVGHGPLPDGRDPRTATVCDPCVGSGRFLLAASNFSFCLYGMDIDGLVCMITRINAALYAPWLAFPFPEKLLQCGQPARPPARLPVPPQYLPPPDVPMYRVDDRGQGLLF
jgi:hypothetical protein